MQTRTTWQPCVPEGVTSQILRKQANEENRKSTINLAVYEFSDSKEGHLNKWEQVNGPGNFRF